MKYLITVNISTEIGPELEAQPEKLQEWIGKWQALKPIGIYFSLTRRAVTILVEKENEDAFFEQLHATWVLTKSYPVVEPIVSAEEFPSIMQRIGPVPA